MNLAQLRSDAELCRDIGVALTCNPNLVLALLNERLYRDEHPHRLPHAPADGAQSRSGSQGSRNQGLRSD